MSHKITFTCDEFVFLQAKKLSKESNTSVAEVVRYALYALVNHAHLGQVMVSEIKRRGIKNGNKEMSEMQNRKDD